MSNVDRYEAVIGRQLNAFVCPVAPVGVLEPVVYCSLSDGFTVHSLVLVSRSSSRFSGGEIPSGCLPRDMEMCSARAHDAARVWKVLRDHRDSYLTVMRRGRLGAAIQQPPARDDAVSR